MPKRKKIGLALGSGAYRGFAHIGVIRSLEKHDIAIDYLSGASIGAWVAAYYAVFGDITVLERNLIDNHKENLSLLLDFRGRTGLISGQKFVAYLEKKLNYSSFADLKIPLQIVATDLATADPYVFKSGSVAEAVRASTAIPLVFQAWEQNKKFLVDGGMSNPVPVNLVRKMGADIVIGVNLYNSKEFANPLTGVTDTVTRGTLILLRNLSRVSISDADLVVEPNMSFWQKHSSLSKYFTKATAEAMIKAGEKAMDKLIPALKKLIS